MGGFLSKGASGSKKRRGVPLDGDEAPGGVGSRQGKRPRIRANNDVTAFPSLPTLPAAVFGHVAQFLIPPCTGTFKHFSKQREGLPELLALQRTCRQTRALMGDEFWGNLFPRAKDVEFQFQTDVQERLFIMRALEYARRFQGSKNKGLSGRRVVEDNEIARNLHGWNGVNRLIDRLLGRMRPGGTTRANLRAEFRFDAIFNLVEIVQDHIVARLIKAQKLVADTQTPGGAYPEIRAKDLRLLDTMLLSDRDLILQHCSIACRHHRCIAEPFGWVWLDSDCCDDNIMEAEERRKMVRALAYRAGVVKMSGEAFSIIEKEILHHIAVLSAYSFELCTMQQSVEDVGPENPRYLEPFERAEASMAGLDDDDEANEIGTGFHDSYFMRNEPPFEVEEDGRIRCVIIARHIKEAALKNGMAPLLGFGLGCGVDDEDLEQYFRDTGDTVESEGGEETA